MPADAFERELRVPASPARCWARITDVPTLVGWVSVLEDARALEPLRRYSATLRDRMGLFSLRADLDIAVRALSEGAWIAVNVEGEDRQMGSRIVVDARVDLLGIDDGGTNVKVAGTYEVTGRVATLGAGTIRQKAAKILDEFFGELERDLG